MNENNVRKSVLAAQNNADLCAAVFAAHGIAVRRDENALVCEGTPLPLYPKVVSLRPGIGPELLRFESVTAQTSFAVKDSFADLPLGQLSAETLFSATWIWKEAPAEINSDAPWKRVASEEDLARWEIAWSASNVRSDAPMFPASLSDNTNIAFFGQEDGEGFRAGCIANLSSEVVGLSNVFGPTNDHSVVDAATRSAECFGAGRPIVGYETHKDAKPYDDLGFENIGNLRVILVTRGAQA
ncbi:hypothetical protein [Ruegeria atlantica]|uniref:hypothetical protein n=1 Tax=Ruegeria atlantica TaxID=81569 RepID=UPI00147CC72D|nr:hypothetical protein [Ruegeria atlantica]